MDRERLIRRYRHVRSNRRQRLLRMVGYWAHQKVVDHIDRFKPVVVIDWAAIPGYGVTTEQWWAQEGSKRQSGGTSGILGG